MVKRCTMYSIVHTHTHIYNKMSMFYFRQFTALVYICCACALYKINGNVMENTIVNRDRRKTCVHIEWKYKPSQLVSSGK